MATNKIRKLHCHVAGIAVLSMLLAACSKAPAPAEPASTPSASEAPAADAPTTAPAPAETPPANSAEPAPAPTPPPATDPSAAPKQTAANIEPALESMQRATPGAKISVPVDLRYQFDANPANNGAVTLHLAAVPRVSGSGLRVSIKPAPGIALKGSTLEVQKANAAGIYRQQFAVTRSATSTDSLRVLVTMDMPEGKAFGYFSIPLGAAPPSGGNPSQKLESVKQR